MLYAFGLDDGDPMSRYIIEESGKLLQHFGVDVRTGFLAPENVERVGVNPLQMVNLQMLSGLLRFDGLVARH